MSLLKLRKFSARLRPLLPAVVALSPVLLCLAFQSAGARPAFSEAAPPKPPLAFHQHMVNLGEVESRRVHEARFWMTNGGADALEIRDVTTSCGCLSDQLEKKIVRPGETTDLTLYIRAANQSPGSKHYTARVTYGPVGQSKTEFEAEVAFRIALPEQTVTLNPRVLIMHQYEGNRVSHMVDVNDLRDRPLTVIDVSCDASFIDVELIPQSEMKPGSRRNGLMAQIRVTAEQVPTGPHECLVRIRTTDPEFAEMTLPMRVYGPHNGARATLPSADRTR
ncbi:MAG: DUF1573 domain-containing protein [Planctomycetota bacterium]|nr:DUF1573 domain-containing protein [Planctomycetota bacterium]MDA1252580.1 DUF1573 domain-containing protein [Planctomycetota bacterium]